MANKSIVPKTHYSIIPIVERSGAKFDKGFVTVKRKKAAAIKYRSGVDSAPKVVAKGQGIIAEKMIALAREHGVPIHEDRDLVEILSTLELNEEIPADLYKAVAEVLAFIYKLTHSVR